MLRRSPGKVVTILLKKDVLQVVGSLQLCGGQFAGSEAVIHTMHDDIFNDDTVGVLLIYAENAFNSINRNVINVILHNLKLICLVIAIIYIYIYIELLHVSCWIVYIRWEGTIIY